MDDGISRLFALIVVQHSTGSLFLIGSAAIVRNSAVRCGAVWCGAMQGGLCAAAGSLVFPLRRQFHGCQRRQSCCCCLGSSVLRLARENSRQANLFFSFLFDITQLFACYFALTAAAAAAAVSCHFSCRVQRCV